MFSGNEQISVRQLGRNYTILLISLGALLVPASTDRGSLPSVAAALLLLLGYLLWTAGTPRPGSAFLKALCYGHYWLLGTLAARMTGLLIQEFLLTGTELPVILCWFYVFVFYNLYKGLECRIRVSEILFPFFLVLLALLTVLMLGETELSRCYELTWSVDAGRIRSGYELFCWLAAVQSLWHLRGSVAEAPPAKWRRAVVRIWAAGAAASLLWGVFTYSIYGNAGRTGLVFPLASAMTLAHFPGNVIGRLDALFVFAWVVGLFLLCSTLFAPLRTGEPDRRGKYLLFALLAASLGLALRDDCLDVGLALLYRVSTPVQIAVLLWQTARTGGKKKTVPAAAAVAILAGLACAGCGRQELEQASIAESIGVDAGEEETYLVTFCFGGTGEEREEPFAAGADSLEEAREIYREYHQKNMDFNHLKNFYFSEELLRSEEFPKLLEEIQVDGSYSRGISAYASEGSAGEAASAEDQPDEGTPVHRLLNAFYNGGECRIPVVTEDGRYKGELLWQYWHQ
ncbi:MAG: hypothetical protein Q4C82_01665 [Eubacteriales bacterium]|nr:hypothetical protein [Eubacteriales bacterium]